MKRDEGGEIRPTQGELEIGSPELGDVTVTRARAIKLGGAALVGGALTVLWPAEADARKKRNKKKKRRRRRRKRQAAVTSDPSTVTFGDTTIGTPSTGTTTITNNGTEPVTVRPEVDGSGFTLVNPAPITLAPGETSAPISVVFTPTVGGPSTGELRFLDQADDLLLETVELVGNGV